MKYLIYGAGKTGQDIQNTNDYDIIGFLDGDINKQGSYINNIKIFSPEEGVKLNYDKIIIGSYSSPQSMVEYLINLGVNNDDIDTSHVLYPIKSRIQWLSDFASILNTEDNSSVAECGVFQGDFAQIINNVFKNKKLYLFDTFEGFDSRDLQQEEAIDEKSGHLGNTSIDIVMSKMKYPDNCIIKKGYFPETALDVDDKFCFVNLDMDLYKPTLEGLRFFAPKMTTDGVILVHDYFSPKYGESIKKAINEFLDEQKNQKYKLFPIGDTLSIAIIKC